MDWLLGLIPWALDWLLSLAPENYLYFGAGVIVGLLTRIPWIGSALAGLFGFLSLKWLAGRRSGSVQERDADYRRTSVPRETQTRADGPLKRLVSIFRRKRK